MIIPQPISQGDTIGIVAPASPFEQTQLEKGMALIRQMGFKVQVPEDIMAPEGYLSNTDTVRAGHINQYFADKQIKAIVCARGGFGSSRILPLIDYDLVRNNPKIFIGFSDITFLLNGFYKKCGLVTFHGPMATTLAESDRTSQKAFHQVLQTTGNSISLSQCDIICSGNASGPVIGGNLTTLCHLAGTPFLPDSKGCLLLIEDKGEALYRIDRMMVHLEQAGFLSGISGLILGTFTDCGKYNDIVSLMHAFCMRSEIPLVAGFGAGHGEKNMTIPIGLPGVLDTVAMEIRFKKQ